MKKGEPVALLRRLAAIASAATVATALTVLGVAGTGSASADTAGYLCDPSQVYCILASSPVSLQDYGDFTNFADISLPDGWSQLKQEDTNNCLAFSVAAGYVFTMETCAATDPAAQQFKFVAISAPVYKVENLYTDDLYGSGGCMVHSGTGPGSVIASDCDSAAGHWYYPGS